MRFEIPKTESDSLNRYTYVINNNLEKWSCIYSFSYSN